MNEIEQDILSKINNKIKKENECHIWIGHVSKLNECLLQYNYKRYYVHIAVWNYNNPDKIIGKKQRCVRTCGNNLCVLLEHLTIVPISKPFSKEAVWSRIIKKGERQKNGCLLWTGYCTPCGYGQTSVKMDDKYVTYKVHRLSYWVKSDLEKMPIKKDTESFMVRHLCGNSKCFEPCHLKLGSGYENAFDKREHETLLKGEEHFNSTITYDKAKEIKLSKYERSDPLYKTQKERAKLFDVKITIIQGIDKGVSWAEIPDREGNTTVWKNKEDRIKRKKTKIDKSCWTENMYIIAEKHLLSRTDITSEILKPFVDTPCRIMKGKPPKKGYPQIYIFGKQTCAHILALEIKEIRAKPQGLVTRHLCGNKLCCNAEHLKFGTDKENMNDRFIHGTSNAKLSPEIVLEIRETYKKDGLSRKDRALKYNTTISNLKNIIHKYTWKDLESGKSK